jgi:polyisoprenoid-binding protein YceI
VENTKNRNVKNNILLIGLIIMVSATINAQEKLTADSEKSTLLWQGKKVTGEHNGTIKLQDGWLTWRDNKISSGEFTIDMKSIKDIDANERLEGHLKSEDFFGVEKFPVSKIVITGSDAFDNGVAVLRGDLTIKGITNPIVFKAAMQKKDEGTWFFANITVDRTKYNVRYGSGAFFDNLGDKIIYDEFKLKVNLLVK